VKTVQSHQRSWMDVHSSLDRMISGLETQVGNEQSPTFRLGDLREWRRSRLGRNERSPTFRLGDLKRVATWSRLGRNERSPTFRLGDLDKIRVQIFPRESYNR